MIRAELARCQGQTPYERLEHRGRGTELHIDEANDARYQRRCDFYRMAIRQPSVLHGCPVLAISPNASLTPR
jgi:hypothetical protein